MAADSKCTDDHAGFLTKCQKIYRLENGALLGTAGDGDARELTVLLSKAKCTTRSTHFPTRETLSSTRTNFEGILAFPNGRIFMVYVYPQDYGHSFEWTGQIVEQEEGIAAVGSGYQYALGALAAGATAIQAVNAAIKYNSFCGGPVKHEAIKKAQT